MLLSYFEWQEVVVFVVMFFCLSVLSQDERLVSPTSETDLGLFTVNKIKSKSLPQVEFTLKPWLIVLPTLLAISIESSHALQLDVRNHWARDYMDMGQNKGIFERGATGLKIMRKDGSFLELPDVPFPDMSVVGNFGSTTSIGGAYTVTATHNKKFGYWHFSVGDNSSFGKTNYRAVGSIDAPGSDFSAIRLNKFVVETTGLDTGIDTSLSKEAFLERYGVMYQGKKQVIAYRAGAGRLFIQDHNGTVNYNDVKYIPAMVSASLLSFNHFENSNFVGFKAPTSLQNTTTEGDSGSSLFVWDNKLNKWVIVGVLNGIAWSSVKGNYFRYATFNQKTVDELKKRYTHEVNLDSKSLTFDSTDNKYQIDGKEESFDLNKDLSFKGGGDITLSKNLHLGVGGLIFDEGKIYTVQGADPNYNFKGAGIDIGKDTIVHWNIKGSSDDDLHKIGEGTLEVNVSQGNNLKVGNGTILLNADKAFNNIYLANGLATVKLMKKDALNTSDDKGRNGVFFARYGGTLDLNGHSQEFARIAASDDGAIITNTGHTKADVNFKLPKWAYAYHGQFKGNLNVNHKYDDEATTELKHKERHLILDGGANIDGDLSVKNAKLTMQGLPSIHAYFGNGWCNAPKFNIKCPRDYIADFRNRDKAANDRWNSHYKNNNQTSSFEQPDWKTRTFKFANLNLEKADVGIGRNTILLTNIQAQDSNIQFGGGVATYRDEHAGDNVTGFDFQQKLQEGNAEQNDTIYFEGEINASNSKIVSYIPEMAASFNLSNGSSFEAVDKSSVTRLLSKGIKLQDKSTLELGNVLVKDEKDPVKVEKSADSKLSIQDVAVGKASLYLPDDVVKGSLTAFEDGNIHVNKWEIKDNNLASQGNGLIHFGTVEVKGSQHVETANITIKDQLAMHDVNPNATQAGAHEWIGLNVNQLTLESNAKVSAEISNDYLSLENISFNQEHTLIQAQELKDLRQDKRIEFILQGSDVYANSTTQGNKIVFSLSTSSQGPSILDSIASSPVGKEFLAQNPQGLDILGSILEHNNKGDSKYQEAAIKDAISMSDINAGVEALNNIIKRTDDMFDNTSQTVKTEGMVNSLRTAINSRLAALRRSAYKIVPEYHPVASITSVYNQPKLTAEEIVHQSLYVDVSGSVEKNGSAKEHVLSTNIGYDHVFNLDKARMVLGAAFSISKLDSDNGSSTDDAKMHSLTGYFSYEQKEGFEFQSYLTTGYLQNEHSFMPEISLGKQTFDEKSYLLMSSNAFKYHIREGNWSFKPMILADLGMTSTSSSHSEYLKRDGMTNVSLDLGLGLEIDGFYNDMGYSFQASAKRNVYTSADSIGVNLRNSDGYISYDLNSKKEIRLNVNAIVSKRIHKDFIIDVGAGASATTEGAVGLNANARARWLF